MMTYEEYIDSKVRRWRGQGIKDADLSSYGLFDFQEHVVDWSLGIGRACVFAGTGLGKTRMQIAYADQIARQRGPVLIVCPLAVADQTIEEAAEIGVEVRKVRSGPISQGVSITNYDRLHLIEGDPVGIVLDESSILKSHDGAFRKYVTDRFYRTEFKAALTATPAPNDYMELGTHSEFIGAASRTEMLAEYFTHDGGETSKWRLKKHARRDFWTWVSSWAACFTNPEDIGFDGARFRLPELTIHEHIVEGDHEFGGMFGGDPSINATTVHRTIRKSLDARLEKIAALVTGDEPMLIWCSTNDEQDALEKLFPGALSVRGSDSADKKEERLMAFSHGEVPILITKASIAGFGMNWQHCNRMIFASMSYSYEQFFQAVRRCYRFGQVRPVDVHVIYAEAEKAIRDVVAMKQVAHESMLTEMRRFAA